MKTLEEINYWCELITTKNIAELGVILVVILFMAIFIIKERNRK